MNPIHWAFDKLYPAIRYVYERILGHEWFDKITENLWLGGAPTYERDYQFVFDHNFGAIVDLRAEREADIARYREHNIDYLKLRVLDVMVPTPEQLDEGVDFIRHHVLLNNPVLIHCAKGRGRSAALVAAYLMRYEGMSYDEAQEFLVSKRSLVNLQGRHQRALQRWIQKYRIDQPSDFEQLPLEGKQPY